MLNGLKYNIAVGVLFINAWLSGLYFYIIHGKMLICIKCYIPACVGC